MTGGMEGNEVCRGTGREKGEANACHWSSNGQTQMTWTIGQYLVRLKMPYFGADRRNEVGDPLLTVSLKLGLFTTQLAA
jgi:hypothetical protein